MVINKAMEQNSNHVVNSVNLNNNTNSDEKNVNRDFNPSVLGREFVRQYYTMLNEGPQNLFRFYNNNSSLIHGNEQQQAAFGQQDINKRLMSLNFKDCHTKIRQVDSLETGSKSVVVQVIGELSNNGQPMRRFFQTFILAPKTPTHYYVRNDIFRYQDEVFLDDDEGYTEDNMDDQLAENTTDTTDNSSSVLNSSLVVNNQQKKVEKLNGEQEKKLGNDLDRNKFADISPINLVGSTNNELNHSGSEQSLDSKQSSLFNEKPKDLDDEEQKPQDNETATETTTNELTTQLNSAPTPVLVQQAPAPQNEPRTYATMVQKNFGQLNTNTTNLDKNDNLVLNNNITNLNKKDDYISSDWQLENKTNNEQSNETKITTTNTITDKEKRINGRDYSDEQQVFVGNLPQNIEENQLKEFFIKYGQILDIRICQKQGKTPNYGFITFSESEVVKQILSQKPIYFDGHRINVEEKRSGANKFNSNSGNFNSRNSTNVNSSNNSNRNFGSSGGTSSQNQFSAFNSRNRDQDRRNFNNKERKSTLNSTNSTNSTSNNNRTQNSNFSRR